MTGLVERVADVRARIASAAERAGRAPKDVLLVGVSKTFSAAAVLAAADAGITDFGENRAQELAGKERDVGDRARWHFVGSLQTNKVRHVVGTAVLIHSVDGFHLAETIARRAATAGIEQQVLVEVNLSGEASKSGVSLEEAGALALEADALEGISVRGLMAIPAFPADPEDSRGAYRSLARMSSRLQEDLPEARHLSMGMTRDFEVAVEEGATIVRVGEALFGLRAKR